jgi:hypothetical protein
MPLVAVDFPVVLSVAGLASGRVCAKCQGASASNTKEWKHGKLAPSLVRACVRALTAGSRVRSRGSLPIMPSMFECLRFDECSTAELGAGELGWLLVGWLGGCDLNLIWGPPVHLSH